MYMLLQRIIKYKNITRVRQPEQVLESTTRNITSLETQLDDTYGDMFFFTKIQHLW